MGACLIEDPSTPCNNNRTCPPRSTSRPPPRPPPTSPTDVAVNHEASSSPTQFGRANPIKLELMELENIVANTVYLKAREGESRFAAIYSYNCPVRFQILFICANYRSLSYTTRKPACTIYKSKIIKRVGNCNKKIHAASIEIYLCE